MNSLKMLFLLAMLMALPIALSARPSEEEVQVLSDEENNNSTENSATPYSESQEEPTSLRGANRFLRQRHSQRRAMTCDRYPRVCRVAGSKGPDCCRKKCVNVLTDRNNCGKCGEKCRYSQICCRGKCVNPMFNKNHCGRCGNKCHKGDSCVYGICSYA